MKLLNIFKRKEWRTDKRGNKIHRTALIHPNVKLGKNNLIGPYCVIGYAAEWKGHEEEGRVYISDNCTLTGHVTIDSGTERSTGVFRNCYLMKHTHVGHDANILPFVTISPGATVGGFAMVEERSTLGLNSSVHQKCNFPPSSILGMNSCFTKSAIRKRQSKYAGVPARIIGENKTK